jgi:hypothetical protein
MTKMTSVPDGAIPDLVGAIVEHRTNIAQAFPVRSTHASKLGHPCRRMLVYNRIAWDLLPKPDARLMGIFRRGRLVGDDIAQEAQDALKRKGLRVVEQEVHVPPNEFQIGGKVDFGIEADHRMIIPVEAKSMVGHSMDKIPQDDDEAIDFFRKHDQAYMRCYPSQLMTYLHFRKIDAGLIYVRDPSMFRDRQIVLRYDAEWMDELLDAANDVKERSEAIEAQRSGPTDGDFLEQVDDLLPDRVDFSPGCCGRCDFCPWCVQDITKAQGIVDRLTDEDLNANLVVMDETTDIRKANEAANEAVKAHLKAILADEQVGTEKVILTADFGVVAKKNAKSITKKIIPVAELTGGSDDD